MKEARVLFKKAAALGIMLAQYNLARMLWDGKGGPVDMTEARVQYKKAADQGHSEAQYTLANILRKEETARIASEELLAEEKEERESNGKKKKKQKEKKKEKKKEEKKEKEQATTREESIAPSTESLFEEQCSVGGGDALAPSMEPVAAAVCSLEDAGDVTGRGVAVAESTMGGGTTCIVCFEGDKTHAAVPCGHQTVCGPCSKKIDLCPICRAKAQPWVHVRLA